MAPRQCPKCEHQSETDARFCSKCGTSLGACPHCGGDTEDSDEFCPTCGKPVRTIRPDKEIRKVSFRLSSEAVDTLGAECVECGRVVMFSRARSTRLDTGYAVPNGLRCLCGASGHWVSIPPGGHALRCPKCRSDQVVGGTKGFGLGKAAAGAVLLGGVGLLGGLVGSKKVTVSCMKCGYRWQP